jgi:hypothetical protein
MVEDGPMASGATVVVVGGGVMSTPGGAEWLHLPQPLLSPG